MSIEVEVVYAREREQAIYRLQLDEGATVADALAASGIFGREPELDASGCKVGVWGRVAARTQVLRDGDRVEIYRPLLADPKQVRRKNAAAGRKR